MLEVTVMNVRFTKSRLTIGLCVGLLVPASEVRAGTTKPSTKKTAKARAVKSTRRTPISTATSRPLTPATTVRSAPEVLSSMRPAPKTLGDISAQTLLDVTVLTVREPEFYSNVALPERRIIATGVEVTVNDRRDVVQPDTGGKDYALRVSDGSRAELVIVSYSGLDSTRADPSIVRNIAATIQPGRRVLALVNYPNMWTGPRDLPLVEPSLIWRVEGDSASPLAWMGKGEAAALPGVAGPVDSVRAAVLRSYNEKNAPPTTRPLTQTPIIPRPDTYTDIVSTTTTSGSPLRLASVTQQGKLWVMVRTADGQGGTAFVVERSGPQTHFALVGPEIVLVVASKGTASVADNGATIRSNAATRVSLADGTTAELSVTVLDASYRGKRLRVSADNADSEVIVPPLPIPGTTN